MSSLKSDPTVMLGLLLLSMTVTVLVCGALVVAHFWR